ncbi:MAG: CBS domain-containing protein/gamma-glutamylcysteine synthetase [Saprospiraceae bacterium]|jgi:CBS domain-containing protein/gamma-glutamylcysteine synthetase
MGEQRVSKVTDQKQMQKFVKSLLKDVQALEYMIENDWFDTGITRMGAEQEMALVHKDTYKPNCIAMEVLDKMKEHDWVETELAKFNLETNLTPRELTKACFSQLHEENASKLDKIQAVLDTLDTNIVLTGILPTLRKFDLDMENLTPKKRYKALMEAINEQLIGSAYELRLTGIDELLVKHDSPLLEACNTSFQIHLQVDPDDFVHVYNIAQAVTAPVMAIAANSPIVFGRRLWHESRIALFQQSLDTRTTHDHMRERSPRVSFGRTWLQDSIMEIYKEDISRFRVLISSDVTEDSLEMIKNGEVPKLRSLQVHNSTVYRWNRPCYGISENGKPHLRIENRVIPAGPTVLDEVANACFWLGLTVGMADEIEDIRELMSFEDARDNFGKAARFGIDSKFTWFNDRKVTCVDLIINELLPIARKGLKKRKVAQKDIDLYLGIIQERAESHMNGARWQLRSYTELIKKSTRDEALTVLTSAMIKNQQSGIPGHKWEMPELKDLVDYRPTQLKVSEFMETDLFTVQKSDIIELVAEMMDWQKIRYAPVEDIKGNLVGLVSRRLILRSLIKNKRSQKTNTVENVMLKDPITIDHNDTIINAMKIMKENDIGCLPVINNGELAGVITEVDFLRISGRLIQRLEDKNAKLP